MNNKDKFRALEQVISQMRKPVKDIPFSVIIKPLADRQSLFVWAICGDGGVFENRIISDGKY